VTTGPLSHSRFWRTGVVQAVAPSGVLDLGPGYLDPGLLPVDLLKGAYTEALAEYGSAALAYGADSGAWALRSALAARTGASADQVVVTSGISAALHLIATTLARPGDEVLVEQTSYDLGRRILTDSGLVLREVPGDSSGMDPRALAESTSPRTAFVLLNPSFHNPTGRTMPAGRRAELLEVAARLGILIVEDDAYAEVVLDGPPPPAIAEMAGYEGVIRLATVSKTLAPGLRLGWLVASRAMAGRLAGHGVFASGGCPNHTTSLAFETLLRTGQYDRHLLWLRDRLRARRDALVGPLRTLVAVPCGGYFVWLRAPQGVDLLDAARRAGVSVADGARFGSTDVPGIRLSFSFNSPDRLAGAASRLAGELRRQ
jgi:2-aminoadipate transaminase